jgi:DNA mismatch endonuclease (patch repair protein)
MLDTGEVPNLFVDPAARSGLMSLIRSTNTKSEVLVYAELRRRGLSFQRHYDRAPGKPDVARPRKKLAVFIDGDFWHGRELDRVVGKHGEDSYWVKKLRRNVQRDADQQAELLTLGWLVYRVWESDLRRARTRAETLDGIEAFLRSRDEPSD